jgi:hypothetical protein
MTFLELKNILIGCNLVTPWDNFTDYPVNYTIVYDNKLYQSLSPNKDVIPGTQDAVIVWKEILENFE